MNVVISSSFLGNIEVIYQAKTIKAEKGSTVKLSCEAKYDFAGCENLHVVWHMPDQNTELTEPLNYFTTVSEKQIGVNVRERTVITEILSVNQGDSGRYQCKADCSGQIAMGHFITVNVTGMNLRKESLLRKNEYLVRYIDFNIDVL